MPHEIIMFTSDKAPGGIRQMLKFYSQALRMKNYNVTLAVPKKSEKLEDFEQLANDSHFKLVFFTKLDLQLLKLGLKTSCFKHVRPNSRIIVHTAKLMPLIKRAYPSAHIISVNHTDKIKSLVDHRKSDAVIVLSEKQKTFFCDNGFSKDKLHKIANCTNRSSYLYEPKTTNKIVFGSLGRFVANKGFDNFITALSSVNAPGVLAGDGAMAGILQAQATRENAQIDFLGWVRNQDEFFSKIDVFCLPSNFEPFGLVVLEAFARGIPVIATKTAGPLDIIVDGENGLLVDINAPDQMAQAMKRLQDDRMLLRRLAHNGFDSFVKNYTIEVLAENLHKLLKYS